MNPCINISILCFNLQNIENNVNILKITYSLAMSMEAGGIITFNLVSACLYACCNIYNT